MVGILENMCTVWGVEICMEACVCHGIKNKCNCDFLISQFQVYISQLWLFFSQNCEKYRLEFWVNIFHNFEFTFFISEFKKSQNRKKNIKKTKSWIWEIESQDFEKV